MLNIRCLQVTTWVLPSPSSAVGGVGGVGNEVPETSIQYIEDIESDKGNQGRNRWCGSCDMPCEG